MTNNRASQPYRCCDEYEEYRAQAARRSSRRDFLKTATGFLAAAPAMPHLLLNETLLRHASSAPAGAKVLVVIQLQGGNDGLNTIVPFGSNLYYGDRPNIAVPAKSVLPIDGMVGFSPNLAGLKALYDAGKVAVVQGVGYGNPSRSHFQGTAIWETGDTSGTSSTGWLGRYLDATEGDSGSPLTAIALGPRLPQTLLAQRATATSIENVNTFRFVVDRSNANQIMQAYTSMYGKNELPGYLGVVQAAGIDAREGVQDLQGVTTNYKSGAQYPATAFAQQLQLVAQLVTSGIGTRVVHLTLGGFDDHVAEVLQHANLLKMLGDGLKAFYDDLTLQGKQDDVLTMTFSEFGRRVRENAGRGTDHGTAAPVFVVGGGVKGGMYGNDPVLSTLDSNGDLIYGVDFRSVYASVLDGWLGTDPKGILGADYPRVGFL